MTAFIEALFEGESGGFLKCVIGVAIGAALLILPMRGCIQQTYEQEYQRDKLCLSSGGIPQHSTPYCYWSKVAK